jgi:SAM-dependent methyltransferase
MTDESAPSERSSAPAVPVLDTPTNNEAPPLTPSAADPNNSQQSAPVTSEPSPSPAPVTSEPSPAPAPATSEPSPAMSEQPWTESASRDGLERPDSAIPMSSPILSVGAEPVAAGVGNSRPPGSPGGAGSEPPPPSVRRLVPPPKPKLSMSRVPLETGRVPFFPASGQQAGGSTPSRVPSVAPIPELLRSSGWSPPPAATPQQVVPVGATAARNSVGKLGAAAPAAPTTPTTATSRQQSLGTQPQNVTFSGTHGSSPPPPTLPSNVVASNQGPAFPQDSQHPEKGASAVTIELPPASRAALLPRATRESVRRTSSPPPKPRLIPQRHPKETSSVAIQAMRIIAIGSDDSAESELSQRTSFGPPASSVPPMATSQTEARGPELSPRSDAEPLSDETDAGWSTAAALADAGLPTFPAVPRAVPEEVPPPAVDDPENPHGRESLPAPSAQSGQPGTRGAGTETSVGVRAQVPAAAERLESPARPVEPAAAERLEVPVRSVEPVGSGDTEPQPSVRRRPPPPRRNSIPSISTESDPSAVAASQPQAVRVELAQSTTLALEATPTVEAALRQPPPAPSRVPREPPPRPSARMKAAERVQATEADGGAESPDKPKTRVRRPWWEELFGEDFARATAPLNEAQIEQEASFIEESLGVAPGGAVLDVGCGAGHHAVELARRGYGVVGYDLSLHQLALAQETAVERDQKINFLQGDMREMAFEEVFDGMYCWNTTFGFFEEDKNVLVIERMFAALKPGGTLLLDVANRDFVALDQPSSVWYEGDACVCMDDMSVDFFTSRLRVKRSLILDDGRTRECYYSIRLYSLHELGRILHDAGFRVTEASGHATTPGVFLGQTSPRIIVLAQKP